MPQATSPIATVSIGGVPVPCYEFRVEIGAYGQIGRASCKTSVQLLVNQGINIPQLTSGTSYTPIYIGINPLTSGQGITVFGGYYMHGSYRIVQGVAEFWARDFSAVLFDSKRSLADLVTTNQTVSQLITQIANLYNLTPNIKIAQDPIVGVVLNQLGVLSRRPTTLWNLIVLLARSVGANIYTDPSGTLNVLTPTANPTLHSYVYGAPPIRGGTTLGILDIDILHQPQRNKAFRLVVLSHHQQSTVTTNYTITMLNEDISLSTNHTIAAGTYRGAGSGQVSNLLAASSLGIPIYVLRKDGLRPSEVQAFAEGAANEIAKKLFVQTIIVAGDYSVQPLDELSILDYTGLISPNRVGQMLGLDGLTLWVNSVTHSYQMPEQGAGSGFRTTIKGLNLPPLGEGTGQLELDSFSTTND